MERTRRTIPVKPMPTMVVGMIGTRSIETGSLRRAPEGAVTGEVRFDAASLAMYASDASNFRQVPPSGW